eukprot:128731-Pelagomonas_calceolata.AAC.1
MEWNCLSMCVVCVSGVLKVIVQKQWSRQVASVSSVSTLDTFFQKKREIRITLQLVPLNSGGFLEARDGRALEFTSDKALKPTSLVLDHLSDPPLRHDALIGGAEKKRKEKGTLFWSQCFCYPIEHRASSSATVMLQNPGEARGGRQQGGGPRIESLWP